MRRGIQLGLLLAFVLCVGSAEAASPNIDRVAL